jgi:hypothetical protein
MPRKKSKGKKKREAAERLKAKGNLSQTSPTPKGKDKTFGVLQKFVGEIGNWKNAEREIKGLLASLLGVAERVPAIRAFELSSRTNSGTADDGNDPEAEGKIRNMNIYCANFKESERIMRNIDHHMKSLRHSVQKLQQLIFRFKEVVEKSNRLHTNTNDRGRYSILTETVMMVSEEYWRKHDLLSGMNNHDGDQVRLVLSSIDSNSAYSALSHECLHSSAVLSGKGV